MRDEAKGKGPKGPFIWPFDPQRPPYDAPITDNLIKRGPIRDAFAMGWNPFDRVIPPAPDCEAGRGRAFRPTLAQALFVRIAISKGYSLESTAKRMGIAIGTLRWHFWEAISAGRAIRLYWRRVATKRVRKRGDADTRVNPYDIIKGWVAPRPRSRIMTFDIPKRGGETLYRGADPGIRPEDFAKFGRWRRKPRL